MNVPKKTYTPETLRQKHSKNKNNEYEHIFRETHFTPVSSTCMPSLYLLQSGRLPDPSLISKLPILLLYSVRKLGLISLSRSCIFVWTRIRIILCSFCFQEFVAGFQLSSLFEMLTLVTWLSWYLKDLPL